VGWGYGSRRTYAPHSATRWVECGLAVRDAEAHRTCTRQAALRSHSGVAADLPYLRHTSPKRQPYPHPTSDSALPYLHPTSIRRNACLRADQRAIQESYWSLVNERIESWACLLFMNKQLCQRRRGAITPHWRCCRSPVAGTYGSTHSKRATASRRRTHPKVQRHHPPRRWSSAPDRRGPNRIPGPPSASNPPRAGG